MKASELITLLTNLHNQEGDLEIRYFNYGELVPVNNVVVEWLNTPNMVSHSPISSDAQRIFIMENIK